MRRIREVAICSVACLALVAGTSRAADPEAASASFEARTSQLMQVVAGAVPSDKLEGVWGLIAMAIESGAGADRIEEIRSTYGLPAEFVQLATSLGQPEDRLESQRKGARRVQASDRETLKRALVAQLGPDRAAPLFEQLQQALAKDADLRSVLDAAGLSGAQIEALAPAIGAWVAPTTGDIR